MKDSRGVNIEAKGSVTRSFNSLEQKFHYRVLYLTVKDSIGVNILTMGRVTRSFNSWEIKMCFYLDFHNTIQQIKSSHLIHFIITKF